jgi:hypothetical protein
MVRSHGGDEELTGLGSFVVFFWICRFGFGCGEEVKVWLRARVFCELVR